MTWLPGISHYLHSLIGSKFTNSLCLAVLSRRARPACRENDSTGNCLVGHAPSSTIALLVILPSSPGGPSVYSKLIRDQDNKSQATSGDMHIVVRWKQGKSQARPFKIAEASGAQSGTESLENFMCVTESA